MADQNGEKDKGKGPTLTRGVLTDIIKWLTTTKQHQMLQEVDIQSNMFSEEMFSASKKGMKQSAKKEKVKTKRFGKFDEETESYQMFSSGKM